MLRQTSRERTGKQKKKEKNASSMHKSNRDISTTDLDNSNDRSSEKSNAKKQLHTPVCTEAR